ncbi:MAG: hypothetical protein UX57_C0010G0011 [Candidatus Uhrbacteria bacterium GW2011_GWE2_46_68]|uniref:Uncharacterized protein n=2 Tax=Candidatus Uhriibacteriota TaxID=1752732 RepID=A0A0G1Q7E8_9BACT|nr:MAG: hypothetical protein UX45_C0012G0011 [Candidatus Uhrbacteria bacterium GW2011_GWF2_46_218]KKU40767.1 MAG: hypothetical protein UX57_C0010G0011 [Candidatus Uhrbacteria bacterium GW2011_GWE2_46_68]
MEDSLHEIILDLEKTYKTKRLINLLLVWIVGCALVGILSFIFFPLLLFSHQ